MMHAIGYGYATDMWGEANIIFGGIEIVYIGEEFTRIIKSDEKLITL